ncbi:RNA polymerase sigma-70 factor [Chitinophaga cymbidii]|uniref:RNA polymerase sigma-70 factor n=1 Tax=Chitinophaga cymbidii TaxID=1096750 RepID=A0A512RND6_9BACT|nr:RNA polymerase sigma-70 factor [Chitinophaga cymbidii]GEP97201.1 RNA polymerase sigma-70 factor [Chitinophaga cymbidii]
MPEHILYDEDRELLNRLVKGNEEAFTILYDRYYRRVALFVQQLVKLPALAEDISQETFIRIWEAREQLAKVQSFKSYLFVAARNHALNCLKRGASEEALKGEIIRHFQQFRNNTEEEMLTQAYLQHIERVLNALPLQTRRIFRLCREQEHSYEEVAARLGISKNAVKKHMIRSIKSLKSAAEKDLGISFGLALILVSRL